MISSPNGSRKANKTANDPADSFQNGNIILKYIVKTYAMIH